MDSLEAEITRDSVSNDADNEGDNCETNEVYHNDNSDNDHGGRIYRHTQTQA